MIISRLAGGLGNQMFQYAFAKAVAYVNNTSFKIDISDKTIKIHNGYELERAFQLKLEIASEAEKRKYFGLQSSESILWLIKRKQLYCLRNPKIIIEPHFNYWQGYEYIQETAYLVGYWQTEKYFQKINQMIRADFRFNATLNQENKINSDLIANSNSVGVHIRRGDFLKSKKNLSIHGVCSVNYYHEAFNYIIQKVNDPTFFIFSDDLSWVKENINLSYKQIFIDNNKMDESYYDMYLMSLCKHNIIANSSFSWWGAWLNDHQDKMVIAPKKWFASELINDTDLIPNNWIRL